MSFFSLSNAIRAFVLFGVLAFVFVNVKSCQRPATGVEAFATGTLGRLTSLQAPPAQPATVFRNAQGEEVRLSDYRGKPLLLNVWATWCPPCVAEMPMLDRLAAERDDIEVLTVAFDEPENARAWLEERGLDLPDYADTGYTLTARLATPEMNQLGLPITVFYNGGGREVARVLGEVDWDKPEARGFLDYVVTR